MRYHLTSARMVFTKKEIIEVGKSSGKRDPSYAVGGNMNKYNHL